MRVTGMMSSMMRNWRGEVCLERMSKGETGWVEEGKLQGVNPPDLQNQEQ